MKRAAKHPRRRRGTVLIVSISIIFILAGLVLVLCRSMRVEAMASANYVGQVQASAIERGAEQYLLALLEEQRGQALYLDETEFEGVPIGEGFFWVIRPTYGDPEAPLFGLTDEASKMNINAMNYDTLLGLPGITSDVVDAIIDWRDEDEDVSTEGAESETYLTGEDPYSAKNSPFETVEELLLVRGVTREVLYGASAYSATSLLPGNSRTMRANVNEDWSIEHGLFDYVTVFSYEAEATGQAARINVNDPEQDAALQTKLTELFGDEGTALALRIPQLRQGGGGGPPGGGQGPPGGQSTGFDNIWDFYLDSQLSPEQIDTIAPHVTAAPLATAGQGQEQEQETETGETTTPPPRTPLGKVNLNTAPRDILLALGMDQTVIDSIISTRYDAQLSGSSDSFLLEMMGPDIARNFGSYVTGQSDQFSADIVAASGNGRSFKRVRVVFDISQTTPRIIYRKDLTARGWPLPPEILEELRAGRGAQIYGTGENRTRTTSTSAAASAGGAQ